MSRPPQVGTASVAGEQAAQEQNRRQNIALDENVVQNGEKRGLSANFRPRTENFERNEQSSDVNAGLTTPVKRGREKRTSISPSIAEAKNLRVRHHVDLPEEDEVLSPQRIMVFFRDGTDPNLIALYCMSVGFEILRHLKVDREIPVANVA